MVCKTECNSPFLVTNDPYFKFSNCKSVSYDFLYIGRGNFRHSLKNIMNFLSYLKCCSLLSYLITINKHDSGRAEMQLKTSLCVRLVHLKRQSFHQQERTGRFTGTTMLPNKVHNLKKQHFTMVEKQGTCYKTRIECCVLQCHAHQVTLCHAFPLHHLYLG